MADDGKRVPGMGMLWRDAVRRLCCSGRDILKTMHFWQTSPRISAFCWRGFRGAAGLPL